MNTKFWKETLRKKRSLGRLLIQQKLWLFYLNNNNNDDDLLELAIAKSEFCGASISI
jgi:hypothetical protein